MNSLSPLVTIVTLVHYTNPEFVIAAIESIYNQTYTNIEHIIVNDAPDDKQYWPQIKKYLKDNNLPSLIIEHKENFGVCKSLNEVLNLSKGKYFCGCCDDIILPNKITVEVNTLENLDEIFVATYSDAFLIDDNGDLLEGMFIEKHREFKKNPEGNIFNELIDGNFLPAMSMMWRTDKIKEVGWYDESLLFEDYDLHLRLFKLYNVKFIDVPTSKYRIHSNSLSNKIKDWDYDYFLIFSKHKTNKKISKKILELKNNVVLKFDNYNDLKKFEIKFSFLWYILYKCNIPRIKILSLINILRKIRLILTN
jgi:glycosyltransferase involved in cell wall biosynthesis